jgi:hypothetical protein
MPAYGVARVAAPRRPRAYERSRRAQLNYCLVEATRVVAAELVREGQGPPPGVDEHAVATGTMQTLREMPGEHLKWCDAQLRKSSHRF